MDLSDRSTRLTANRELSQQRANGVKAATARTGPSLNGAATPRVVRNIALRRVDEVDYFSLVPGSALKTGWREARVIRLPGLVALFNFDDPHHRNCFWIARLGRRVGDSRPQNKSRVSDPLCPRWPGSWFHTRFAQSTIGTGPGVSALPASIALP